MMLKTIHQITSRGLCLTAGFLLCMQSLKAQPSRWQQRIRYVMDVQLTPQNHQLRGTQKIAYTNNSPDTLTRLFMHLYWNAFQPGSSMDVRSRELGKNVLGTRSNGEKVLDWDGRVRDRISALSPADIGIQRVEELKMGGRAQRLIEHETILEVVLDKPILPGQTVPLETRFFAQVPEQIRRSGRNNAEGVQYSMSQWYPKMVEYDYQGWNANPYVAREFYGVWGDFSVNITLPKDYLVAAGGKLLNANQIGFGYEDAGVKVPAASGANLTWRFEANNVHDFVWAADTQYKLLKQKSSAGPMVYVVYKNNPGSEQGWKNLMDSVLRYYPYMAKTFGAYPYPVYSFIQGGDGGMEYPMATLVKSSSLGTAVHEWMHSWYQMMLGSNESLYPWMDEGFTSYAESRTIGFMRGLPRNQWLTDDYAGYIRLAKSGLEEPMSTHADHYNTNFAYSLASYAKGAVFLAQLGYICGEENLDKILLAYYNAWRFKHPNPNDFVRVAEKVSGMELDWYKEYMLNTTKTIDYAVGNTEQLGADSAIINLKRIGQMPMPVDLLVTLRDGSRHLFHIPLNLMYGSKPQEDKSASFTVAPAWRWTHPEYALRVKLPVASIKEMVIDPDGRMADLNRVNNKVVVP